MKSRGFRWLTRHLGRYKRDHPAQAKYAPYAFGILGALTGGLLYAIVLSKLFAHYVQPGDSQVSKLAVLDLVGKFLAGTAVFIGLLPAWQTLRISREGQITTRYTQAVAQLGDESQAVRLGGIYALERIARDSDRDYRQIMEVLTAYIRDRTTITEYTRPTLEPGKRPTEDVQAALFVLGRRRYSFLNRESKEGFVLDLYNTDLRGADLHEVDLSGANLRLAHLEGSDLRGATIVRANLCMTHFMGALLDGAFVTDLSMAHGISWEQIGGKVYWLGLADEDTKHPRRNSLEALLPNYINIPEDWA